MCVTHPPCIATLNDFVKARERSLCCDGLAQVHVMTLIKPSPPRPRLPWKATTVIMSSMQAYLAEKYMSGPKADAILSRQAPKKKKKRALDPSGSASGSARAAPSGRALITDDDAGWGDAADVMDVEEDDVAEAVVASDRAFKKRRAEPIGERGGGAGGEEGGSGGWAVVREPTPPPAADEQPVVVPAEDAFRGGLLTKKQLRSQLPSSHRDLLKRKGERGGGEKDGDGDDEDEDDPDALAAAQETVYRDSSGRKIDMKAEKAEAARKKREREEREARKMEWGRGLVQRDEAEKRKRDEERIRHGGFTRYADDEELNRAQKDQERWNDPAAAFMTKKRTKGPRKPEYSGPPPPPNRFGIKPGYRWDGVDRGNGFEKKYFQKQNERRRTGAQSHKWSVEDM
ncbi:Pre-mRNA-splicing factor of RES complex-domain-containing protein [Russula earlei]|uniref:Pre-mRNA-splicing factor of RES complex-domain-containing protein n=1 Tax=Russula earlei TaxID=71964 RepID=A0ACC0U6Y7_9AGAM|nr:Pre-mRNA-splicing factor of RES complex-domain-containing protein [Russula earlei]